METFALLLSPLTKWFCFVLVVVGHAVFLSDFHVRVGEFCCSQRRGFGWHNSVVLRFSMIFFSRRAARL